MTQEDDRGKSQAKAQLESIIEMVDALENATTDEQREEAEMIIHEDPLSVQVRNGWHNPGEDEHEAEEFEILLCTGGPAARIVGDLSRYNTPERARLEYQDWFTAWTEYPLISGEEEKVLTYCSEFYFA